MTSTRVPLHGTVLLLLIAAGSGCAQREQDNSPQDAMAAARVLLVQAVQDFIPRPGAVIDVVAIDNEAVMLPLQRRCVEIACGMAGKHMDARITAGIMQRQHELEQAQASLQMIRSPGAAVFVAGSAPTFRAEDVPIASSPRVSFGTPVIFGDTAVVCHLQLGPGTIGGYMAWIYKLQQGTWSSVEWVSCTR